MGSANLDSTGRPVVAITGMGLVTSLGVGKSDNWRGIAGGQSGIRPITRFPTDGLKTTIAGTVEHFSVEPYSAFELATAMAEAAAAEAIGEARIGVELFPIPHHGHTAFGLEWPHIAPLTASPTRADWLRATLANARTGSSRKWQSTSGSPPLQIAYKTGSARGSAYHLHGLRIRRHHDPTRCRSHSPRTDGRSLVHRHGCHRPPRRTNPLLSSFCPLDEQHPPAEGFQAFL
jgi:hypothetical protein